MKVCGRSNGCLGSPHRGVARRLFTSGRFSLFLRLLTHSWDREVSYCWTKDTNNVLLTNLIASVSDLPHSFRTAIPAMGPPALFGDRDLSRLIRYRDPFRSLASRALNEPRAQGKFHAGFCVHSQSLERPIESQDQANPLRIPKREC